MARAGLMEFDFLKTQVIHHTYLSEVLSGWRCFSAAVTLKALLSGSVCPCRVCHTILVMVGEPEKLNEGPARPGRGSALEPGMELTDRPPLAYDLTSGAQARAN